MASLTWSSVLAWRMRRQHLVVRADDPLRVVSDIAGLHAQVFSSSELTLWARVDGPARGWLEEALWQRRALVKTWAMRGTLHLLRSDELAEYVGALSRLRPRHHVPAWQRAYGLTLEQADAMLAAVADALAGEPLTRDELATAVGSRVADAAVAERLGSGFGELLKPAAFTGDLCFAPNDGRIVRFTRPASWLKDFTPPGPSDAAASEVVRTYLRAYGPAPREQFQRWFGMTSPAEAGRWIAALGDEVVEVDVEGSRGWMLVSDVEEARPLRRPARSACCRRSTTTSSRRRATPMRCCRPRIALVYIGRKAGCRPCCWSTAGSSGCGRTRSKATGWRSPSSRSGGSGAMSGARSRRRRSASRRSSGARCSSRGRDARGPAPIGPRRTRRLLLRRCPFRLPPARPHPNLS